MKNRLFLLFVVCCFTACSHAGIIKQFPFQGCSIELLDSAGAAEATHHSDAYTKAQTTFDRKIRLSRQENITEQDYLDLAAAQALSWDKEDAEKLQQSFGEIEKFLKENNIRLNLPKTIQLLKTAGDEEFGAEGYTRENRIMLCLKGGEGITTHTVAHELFHVYSRFNAAVSDKVYAIFGFARCNRINTAAAMQYRMITNPDCPFIEHYITLPWKKSMQPFVLQLYSTKAFDGHFTFGDVGVGLLAVTGNDTNMHPSALANGKPIFYQLDEMPEFFNKIGKNTSYVLHPEEISAEHFAMWVIGQKVPQPEYFDKMKTVLAAAK